MRVTKITDEFLHITNVGGIDVRVLPGAPVTVHTDNGEELTRVIAMPSLKLLPEINAGRCAGDEISFSGYWPDSTRSAAEGAGRESRFHSPMQPMELAGDILSGHTLDNRALSRRSQFAWRSCRANLIFGMCGQLPQSRRKLVIWAHIVQRMPYVHSLQSQSTGHLPKVQVRTAGRRFLWEKVLAYAWGRICIHFCIASLRIWQNGLRSPGSWT